jgi:hypothetical protein
VNVALVVVAVLVVACAGVAVGVLQASWILRRRRERAAQVPPVEPDAIERG